MRYNILNMTTIYAILIAWASLMITACPEPEPDKPTAKIDKSTPEKTSVPVWRTVAAGSYLTVGMKTDGSIWAWGWNYKKKYVLGGITEEEKLATPTQVGSDTWKQLTSGVWHAVGIKTDDTLWAWGSNGNGKLGNGKSGKGEHKKLPIQVSSDTWKVVAAGSQHTVGIKTNGTLWAWGENYDGQIGNGKSGYKAPEKSEKELLPVQVGSDTWKVVAAGNQHTVGIKTDDTLWAWGQNAKGQIGNGKYGLMVSPIRSKNETRPVQIGSDAWKAVAAGQIHTVGIKTDGSLWAWGTSSSGQLGMGPVGAEKGGYGTLEPRPTQESSKAANWSTVFAGHNQTFAIKTNGSLWAWGFNESGQLGVNDKGNKISPTQVGTDTDWHMVATGMHHTVGIKKDGTLFGWGSGYYGQLGLGDTKSHIIPTKVKEAAPPASSP